MFELVTKQLVSLTVAAVFGGLISYIISQRNKNKLTETKYDDRIASIDLAVFTMIKSILVKDCSRVIRQGFVYVHELEAINLLNCTYIKMDGNGVVKLLMKQVETLDIVSTEHMPALYSDLHSSNCPDDDCK